MISHIPDYPYLDMLHSIPVNTLLLGLIPLLSLGIVLVLYLVEKRKQQKSINFFVNFISLFTNPEMQQFDKELDKT